LIRCLSRSSRNWRSLAYATVLLGLFVISCQRTRTETPDIQGDVDTQTATRDTMKIQFERSGGFAGTTVSVDIDSDSLSESDSRLVMSLVEQARFFSLPVRVARAEQSRGADQFVYRITIEKDGRRHTVETTDGDAPPTLIPLLDWLNGAARRARSPGGP